MTALINAKKLVIIPSRFVTELYQQKKKIRQDKPKLLFADFEVNLDCIILRYPNGTN